MPSRPGTIARSLLQSIATRFPVALLGISAFLLSGCRHDNEIVRYRVPKSPEATQTKSVAPPPRPSGEPTDRMLAATIIRHDRVWFFKAIAKVDRISPHADEFQEFVQSVKFDGETPSWDLPEDWQQQSGSGMRFATLSFGEKQEPIELTVIPLPLPPGDERAYVLSNVNRWRGQLQLDPITQEELDSSIDELEIPDGKVSIADLRGWSGGSARPMAPFVDGNRTNPAPVRPAPVDSASTGGRAAIEYETPNGWQVLPATGMRAAAFSVTEGDQSAKITVIPLPGRAGDLLSNVNRWRGQIDLGKIDAAELESLASDIEIGGVTGNYVELAGDTSEGQAIFGVSAEKPGTTWFVKMTGDRRLLEKQRENFRSFTSSIRFTE